MSVDIVTIRGQVADRFGIKADGLKKDLNHIVQATSTPFDPKAAPYQWNILGGPLIPNLDDADFGDIQKDESLSDLLIERKSAMRHHLAG